MPTGTPTYLTISPQGNVGANFTGHVHAQGLDLDAASSSTPPDQDRIRWIKQSDGSVVAHITAYSVPNGTGVSNELVLSADGGSSPVAALQANEDSGSLAEILVDVSQVTGNAEVQALLINSHGGIQNPMIMDSAGNSSFLQALTSGIHKVAFGVGVSTWPGGSTTSNVTTLPHGLGSIPACVIVSPLGQPCLIWQTAGPNATNMFVVQDFKTFVPAVGAQSFFYWLAIT